MSKKLKTTYILLVGFCMLSLVAFQNCSQGSSGFGDYTGGSTGSNNNGNGNNGGNNNSCGAANSLACLLTDGIFKYIITDASGNVLYHNTNTGTPLMLQASGHYRMYVAGVESAAANLPAVDKWVGCAVSATSDNNGCINFPTQVLVNPTNCQTSAAQPFRPVNCDSAWRIETQGSSKYIVNYDMFYTPQGQQWIPANITIYTYMKANAPQSSSAVRLVYTTY